MALIYNGMIKYISFYCTSTCVGYEYSTTILISITMDDIKYNFGQKLTFKF